MIGGEFIIRQPGGVEQIVSNRFTILGLQQMLRGVFWGEDLHWYVGLCAANPGDSVQLGVVGEPSGNGYVRQDLNLTPTNWPVISIVNGESFVESKEFTFPVSAPYDVPVNRMFLTDGNDVIAVSSAIEGGLQTVSSAYTAKYRLYFR